MDPVQALILKLMEQRAGQDRQAQIPFEYNRDVERLHSPAVGIQQLRDIEVNDNPQELQPPPDMGDSGFSDDPQAMIRMLMQRGR